MRNFNKKAFSVAEMMIVLLVLSIVLAASMPVITKRSKSSVDKTWQATTNGANAFFGIGANQGIVVGAQNFPNGSFGKLLLNVEDSSNTDVSHILFSSSDKDGILAKLRIAENQFEFGKNANANSTNATAIGHNTRASENAVAVGDSAEAKGSNSAAVAYNAKASASNSTSFGASSTASKLGSTAIGAGASASGENSIAIGYNAAAEGQNSIAIGSGAAIGTANAVAIGDYRFLTESNVLTLKPSSSISTVNFGFGVSEPEAGEPLSGEAKTLNIGDSASNVFIEGNQVKIKGSLYINDAPYMSSDIRRKNIIGEYKSGLDEILKLKTVEFTYKSDLNKNKRVGIIAQELQKIFPNAVKIDDSGYLTIRHEDMFFAIINAIKELNAKITALQQENKNLSQKVEELSKRVEALEKGK